MPRRRLILGLATLRRPWGTAGPLAKAACGLLSLAWAAAIWAPAAGGQTPDRQLAGQGFWGVHSVAPQVSAPHPLRVSQAAHDVWASTDDQPSRHEGPKSQRWVSEDAVYPGSLPPQVLLPGGTAGLTWQPPYPDGYAGPGGPLAGAVPPGVFGSWPSGSRHWVRHFGYRRAYTQWTLK